MVGLWSEKPLFHTFWVCLLQGFKALSQSLLHVWVCSASTELKSGDALAAALSNLDSQLRFAVCVSCSGVQAVYFSTER